MLPCHFYKEKQMQIMPQISIRWTSFLKAANF
jgi:hypothetical protein